MLAEGEALCGPQHRLLELGVFEEPHFACQCLA
jgi:hypothetical protein